jgi:molybdate transport system substrate-binding protein
MAAVVAGAAVVASGCGSSAGVPATGELTIFAAASLREVIELAAVRYEAAHPGLAVIVASGSSAALATQIEQGAPADVFLSADEVNPDRIISAGLAAGPAVVFAVNEPVLAMPAENPAGLTEPADLARDGLRIVAAGRAVPITAYADLVLARLAAEPGYSPDFADRYRANVVSREDDVAVVLVKLELGEADAGFVYATDVRRSTRVATLPLPPAARVRAPVAGVVLASAASAAGAAGAADAATAFLAWLAGPQGGAILASHGFLPAGGR